MPHITKKYRREAFVMWRASGTYDNFGNPIIYDPVEILGRWENVNREVRSVDGSVVACDALVYVKVDVPVQSIFWRGALADLPATPTGLFIVQEVNDTPALNDKNKDRYCFMLAYSNKLPTSVSGTGTG